MIHPSSVTSRKVLPFVSAQRGKTKAGGGEERCSLSIVIKHDRMQFQSAASVPVESWRCLDRTLLSFCPVAINTFARVLFNFPTQSWTERAKGLTADAADLKKRKRAEGGRAGAMENEREQMEDDESGAKKKRLFDSGSSKLSAFAYTKNWKCRFLFQTPEKFVFWFLFVFLSLCLLL